MPVDERAPLHVPAEPAAVSAIEVLTAEKASPPAMAKTPRPVLSPASCRGVGVGNDPSPVAPMVARTLSSAVMAEVLLEMIPASTTIPAPNVGLSTSFTQAAVA